MAQVHFTAQSRKILQNIRKKTTKDKITNAIQKLSQKPLAGKKLQGKLKGAYSIRIWPYRILYELTKTKEIIITDIEHRKDVYG